MHRLASIPDTLTTVDRYPGSPTHGAQTFPGVMLWQEAGQGVLNGTLKGFLPHGHAVRVLAYVTIEANVFALIKAEHEGRIQRGWCNVMFLEQAGAAYLREVLGVVDG